MFAERTPKQNLLEDVGPEVERGSYKEKKRGSQSHRVFAHDLWPEETLCLSWLKWDRMSEWISHSPPDISCPDFACVPDKVQIVIATVSLWTCRQISARDKCPSLFAWSQSYPVDANKHVRKVDQRLNQIRNRTHALRGVIWPWTRYRSDFDLRLHPDRNPSYRSVRTWITITDRNHDSTSHAIQNKILSTRS